MIKFSELLDSWDHLDDDAKANIHQLHYKLNFIRRLYGKPMIVTSGFRTETDHKRIYLNKGIIQPPMGSHHLIGAAADIYDPQSKLQEWVLDNLHVVEELSLYMEDFDWTSRWVHFSIYPPASGKRFFTP